MDKLKMHSPDLTGENIAKLAELFPQCVVECRGKNGELARKIDFEALQQELSGVIVDGAQERYMLNWPGKREAILLANTSVAKTLRPCREESVDFENTKNLYIEGDNLEVLKLIRDTYLGKVKMIYIDPPYNTGNDFIYHDHFAVASEVHKEKSEAPYRPDGFIESFGSGSLESNPETKGRYHSDWLSMIYPRIRLAHQLLCDEGVIFISIDDNEIHNLRKICDEIFGEENFVADICVVNNLKGRNDKKYIARANERLLMYVKTLHFEENGLSLGENTIADYKNKDAKGLYRLIELRKRGGADTRKERPNMYYSFFVNPTTGGVSLARTKEHCIEAVPVKSDGTDGRWRWGKETAQQELASLYGQKVQGSDKYNIYEKDYLEREDGIRRIRPKSVMAGALYSTDIATKEYRNLMGSIDFSSPKPVAMLSDLVEYSIDSDSEGLVLDFFSGSATTAHAVMKLNSEDGGKRQFIMVQLPELCANESEAFKAGYKTICEIGKERIRRAGAKIKAEWEAAQKQSENDFFSEADGQPTLDIGFRVLKLDSSNMEDTYYTPDDTMQNTLDGLIDNVKPDRKPLDLLFQIMLDWGVELSAPITEEKLNRKTVYFVDTDAIAACFDTGITDELVRTIAERRVLRAVFRDNGFATDAARINVKEIFKQLSPATEMKVI